MNYGHTLLAIGLLVWGLSILVTFAIPPLVAALWAIVTGLLLLVGK